jgi:hypothetical protein
MEAHYEIPATFDGDMVDLAFLGEERPVPLKFGQSYPLTTKDGVQVPGRFYHATVVEKERVVYGAFQLETGENIIATIPLSEAELAAYKKHPDTFFGEVRDPPSKGFKTPLDLTDFVYASYKNTPRERLLEFLADAPDYEQLKNLSQKDLAITYSERIAWSMFQEKKSQDTRGQPLKD